MKKFKKIYVEITNICNLNCSFCSRDNRKKKEMTVKEFENILQKIDKYTDYIYLHVKGEPLIHTKFEQILGLAKKYNKKVNITTNATKLKEQLDSILGSTVRQVNISLQSLTSLDYIDDIIYSADAMAKKGINVQYRMWVENNKKDRIMEIIEEHYNKKIDLPNVKLSNNIFFNKDEEFIWPSLANDIISEKGTCYGTRSHIGILSDGTVVPCCLDSNGDINLGNIFEHNLEDIVNSERFKNMKEDFQNCKISEELCKRCGFIKKIKK